MSELRGNGPNVRLPPPLLFVAGFLVGWSIDAKVYHLWPAALGHTFSTVADVIGGVLFGGGIIVAASGVLTFRRAKTSIVPIRDASTLVRTGPYAVTRNPMYLGLTLSYTGLAILLDSGWSLVVLPIVLVALTRLVIEREERYMETAFGDEYRAYQREVGRWW
jgi:protein-S-isoprenylcysteine O-methyltransferase Ste14